MTLAVDLGVIASFADLSHSLKFVDHSLDTPKSTESYGIVVNRFVDTPPDILGLVCRRFRSKSGSNKLIF